MKRILLLFTLIAFLTCFVSCGSHEPDYFDPGQSFLLELNKEGPYEKNGIVLQIERNERGYSAHFIEPEVLSLVSVMYSEGYTVLQSGSVEMPLSSKAASGVEIVFKVIDRLFEGPRINEKSVEIDGNVVTIDDSPDPSRIEFSLNDGQTERNFILRKLTENYNERNPDPSG